MFEFTFPRENVIDQKWVGSREGGGCTKKWWVEYAKMFI